MVEGTLLDAILCDFGDIFQDVGKKLARDGPSIKCAECIEYPAFDALDLRKAAAAAARRIVQNGEISYGVPDERHPVIVQVGHQDFRRTGGGRRCGFYE